MSERFDKLTNLVPCNSITTNSSRADPASGDDDDLTAAYLAGFERGKDASNAEIERLKGIGTADTLIDQLAGALDMAGRYWTDLGVKREPLKAAIAAALTAVAAHRGK